MKRLMILLALISCEKTEPAAQPQSELRCETIVEVWPCKNGICSAGTDKKMVIYDDTPFKIGQKVCF